MRAKKTLTKRQKEKKVRVSFSPFLLFGTDIFYSVSILLFLFIYFFFEKPKID